MPHDNPANQRCIAIVDPRTCVLPAGHEGSHSLELSGNTGGLSLDPAADPALVAFATAEPELPPASERPIEGLCALCSKPVRGHAVLNGERYCHEGDSPTCYERAEWTKVLRVATPHPVGCLCVRCRGEKWDAERAPTEHECDECYRQGYEAATSRIERIIEGVQGSPTGGVVQWRADLLAAIRGGDDA